MPKIIGLKSKIEWCLKNMPETRNSDIKLTLNLWLKFYPDKVQIVNGEYYIHMRSLYDIPREDSIKRLRAIIQGNEGRYLPTSEMVLKKRRMKEELARRTKGEYCE